MMYRRSEVAYGYYCTACGEHVWGFRGPMADQPSEGA
jgi:hypothetical protein